MMQLSIAGAVGLRGIPGWGALGCSLGVDTDPLEVQPPKPHIKKGAA